MENEENYEPKALRTEDKSSGDGRRWAREFIRREGVIIFDPDHKFTEQFYAARAPRPDLIEVILLAVAGFCTGAAVGYLARLLTGLK
jgi:hypothetical protein